MKNVFLKITKNEQLSKDIYLMRLEGDLSDIKNPGEFVEVKLKDYYLRRPISVHDFSENHLDLLYKVLGHGTKDMTNLKVNEELEVLIGLGNGFDISLSKKPLLIAGGIGISTAVTSAPGTMKFAKAVKRLSKLDVQPIVDQPQTLHKA